MEMVYIAIIDAWAKCIGCEFVRYLVDQLKSIHKFQWGGWYVFSAHRSTLWPDGYPLILAGVSYLFLFYGISKCDQTLTGLTAECMGFLDSSFIL